MSSDYYGSIAGGRPYVPKPGDPYPSFAFLVWGGADPVPVRTMRMLVRQPRKATER